jgi:hypothetical protein
MCRKKGTALKKIYESPEMQSLRFVLKETIANDSEWGDNEFDASGDDFGWGENPPAF